jgi:hypothetical protein
MEKGSPKAVRSLLLSSFLTLALSEIGRFIHLGGLDNPLAFSLLKIIIFLVLFVIFYNERGVDLRMLTSLFELVKTLTEEIRSLQQSVRNNGD